MSNQQWGPPPGQQPQYPPPQQQPWGAPPGQYAGPPPGQYGGPGQYAGPPGQYAGPPAGFGGPPQYQQGFGWGQLPPPPKKKRGGAVVLGILGGLILLGAAGFAIAANVLKNDEPTVTRPAYSPTSRATEPGPFPTARPTGRTTTRQPTRQPTRPVPTKSKPTVEPPTPNQIVTANRLYKTGAQRPMGCRESKAGLATGTKAGQYYRQIKLCLDRAWPRQIVAAGYRWGRPACTSSPAGPTLPCGTTTDGRPFYCPSNHVIYMNSPLHMRLLQATRPSAGRPRPSLWRTSTAMRCRADRDPVRDLPLQYDVSAAKKLELNRRMELQASCLGSVFLGTNKASYGLKGQFLPQWLYIVTHLATRTPAAGRGTTAAGRATGTGGGAGTWPEPGVTATPSSHRPPGELKG